MPRPRSAPYAISLIVPFLDMGRWLTVTAPSLLAQSIPVELIFVNDGSTDDSGARLSIVLDEHRDLIKARKHRVRVLRHVSNRGRSAARNSGVAASTAPLLAFVDADVALPSTWAAQHIAAHEDYGATAVLPRRLPVGVDPTDDFQRYLLRKEALLASEPSGTVVAWKHFVTAAVTLRREAFESTGGFDADVRYGEDTDLGLRLAPHHPKGLRLCPTCVVFHHDPDTLDRALVNFERLGKDELPVLLARHPDLQQDTAAKGARGALKRRLAQLLPERLVRGALPMLPPALHSLGVRGLCLRALQAQA